MASKVIGFRVPEDIALELERISEERGVKVGEFLRRLVDDTLYPPATLKVEEENNNAVNETLESLSNSYADLTDRVQELHRFYDIIRVKLGKYEVEGILDPKLIETIKEVSNLRPQLGTMENLSGRIKQLESEVTRLKENVASLKREIKRQPTDEIHTITFKDGSEHKYRVYRSEAGLVKPRRAWRDLISGDKYVDLSEPLD